MSLTYLTASAMTAITRDMLNSPEKVSILESHPLTEALIPAVTSVHNDLVEKVRSEGDVNERLKKISTELATTDQIHDRTSRGIFSALESAAELVANQEEGLVFIETRDALFPSGLIINTLSYREQAGNVVKVSERCTPANRDVLQRIAIDGVPLTDSFDRWVENGEKMGTLVSERAQLRGEDDDTRTSQSDIRQTRNRWARTMNTLMANLEIAIPDKNQHRTLLSNLREAEADAVRVRQAALARQAAQNGSVDVDDPVEPSPQPM